MKSQSGLPESQFADAFGLAQTLRSQVVRDTKRKNIDLVWQVLEGMWVEGCLDYGLAEVGRKLAKVGGPKTQSLRNEGGQDFRRLIEAFAACAGAQGRARQFQGKSQLDIAVEMLPDPGARAMFRQIVAENKLYKTQNDELRSAFKELSVRRPTTEPQPAAVEPTQVISVSALTAREKELLRRNLSQERFDENGWRISEGGGVVDDAGVVVLSPGFLETLEKLLA